METETGASDMDTDGRVDMVANDCDTAALRPIGCAMETSDAREAAVTFTVPALTCLSALLRELSRSVAFCERRN